MMTSVETKAAPVLNEPLKRPLSQKRKELMLRALDGETDLAGTMYILHAYKFCDNILLWLIAHRYTGKSLRDLLVKSFASSVPALVEYVISQANGKDLTNARQTVP